MKTNIVLVTSIIACSFFASLCFDGTLKGALGVAAVFTGFFCLCALMAHLTE